MVRMRVFSTLMLTAMLSLTACSLGNLDSAAQVCRGARAATTLSASYESFVTKVHPVLVAQCGACHGTQNPAFAPSDAAASWQTFQAKMAILPANEQRPHCGQNCGKPGAVTEAIRAYVAENTVSCVVPKPEDDDEVETNRFATVASTMSTATTTSQVMTFAMGSEVPSQWAGVSFQAAVILRPATATQPGAVILSNFRVVTDVPVRVRGMKLSKNGALDVTNQSLASVDRSLIASANPQVFAASSTSFIFEAGIDNFQITVLLEEPEAVGDVTATVFFAQTVRPVLTNRCAGCHNAGNVFNMGAGITAAQGEANVINRVVAKNPTGSLLLRKGTGVVTHHGNTGATASHLNADEAALLTQWINKL